MYVEYHSFLNIVKHLEKIADLRRRKSSGGSSEGGVGKTGKELPLSETLRRRSSVSGGRRGGSRGCGGNWSQLNERENHSNWQECIDVEESIGKLQQRVQHEFLHLFGDPDKSVNLRPKG